MKKNVVIKLGGSVVSRPEKVFDFEYLKNLRIVLEKYIQKGFRFGIVLGGGSVMRKYRDMAMQEGGVLDTDSLHWIGTAVNVLHAEIARTVFADISSNRPLIYDDYFAEDELAKVPVIIGGGAKAGFSGDKCALLLALRLEADTVVSLKNIDYLYSQDPNIYPNAKVIKQASWDEYFKIIGYEKDHKPGGNYIVDPVASSKAQQSNVKFVIMKGSNLDNFDKFLCGSSFEGSVIG
jgi:uridylate kinase